MESINYSSFLNEETNNVNLVGTISSEFIFSHELYGEKFYKTEIKITRQSGTDDYICIMISERLTDIDECRIGSRVKIEGQLRTYDYHEENEIHLLIFVFAKELYFVDDDCKDMNDVNIIGHMCKNPNYRKTPNGREITDLIIAVNRAYRKSDYLPCICWGRNARYSRKLKVGNTISINGRIQSRTYKKYYDEENSITKTAYEVSIGSIQIIE